MLRIARGDGLPVQGTAQGAGPSVPPSYTSMQLTNMRVYFFGSLLYACLDPPTELGVLASDLSDLCAEWWPYDLPYSVPPQEAYGTRDTDVVVTTVLDQSEPARPATVNWTVHVAKGELAAVSETLRGQCQ